MRTVFQLTFDVGVLDRVLNLRERAHGPRAHRSADLHLARSLQLEIEQLAFCEVRSGQQERHASFVVLP